MSWCTTWTPSGSPAFSHKPYDCVVQLRYNYRVYPTPGQRIELAKVFGCARVVFNDGLRLRQQARGQARSTSATGNCRAV